jgi:hypothetical protein
VDAHRPQAESIAPKRSAPTLEEINHGESALCSTQDVDVLLQCLGSAEDLFRWRFDEIRQRFMSMSVGHPDREMMNLFRHYESRGFAFEQPPQGSGGVDPGLLSAEQLQQAQRCSNGLH